MKAQRSSNIELLRIAAMLLIILCHISCHCMNEQITNSGLFAQFNNHYFTEPKFYPRLLILYLLFPLGAVGNSIFVLISGYFSVQKGKALQLEKITKKLLFQLGFATVLLVVGSTVLYRLFKRLALDAPNLFGIHLFNRTSWFVGYYFIIMLAAKLFLNERLLKLEQSAYRCFLIVLLAAISFSWSGNFAESLASGLRTLGAGIFLYALGGYIKKYNPFERLKTCNEWIDSNYRLQHG